MVGETTMSNKDNPLCLGCRHFVDAPPKYGCLAGNPQIIPKPTRFGKIVMTPSPKDDNCYITDEICIGCKYLKITYHGKNKNGSLNLPRYQCKHGYYIHEMKGAKGGIVPGPQTHGCKR